MNDTVLCSLDKVCDKYRNYLLIGVHSYWISGQGWTIDNSIITHSEIRKKIIHLYSDLNVEKICFSFRHIKNYQLRNADFHIKELLNVEPLWK